MTRITREQRSASRPAVERVDPKSLTSARAAQPADARSIADQKRDHFFDPGSAPSGGVASATWLDGGTRPGKKALVPAGERVVDGDSFGAERINARHRGGEVVGSREEQVSTTFAVGDEEDGTTAVHVEKRKSAEAPAATSSAPAAKTDQERLAELPAEVEKLKAEIQQLKAELKQITTARGRAKQPNPQSDDAPAAPVTRQEVQVQRKGLPGSRGDGDDGRAETQQPSGGGPVRTRGQDDRPEREQPTGALNVNRMLQIDQLVNPVRV